MKKIRIFFRSIRDAFKSVGRNFSLSLASILCVTITLVIVSVAILISVNVTHGTKAIEDDMSIVVYLKKEATETDVDNLKTELDEIKGIKEYLFVSKEQAKMNMASFSDSFEKILNYLGDNPLLDSFVVYVEDVKDLSEISSKILELPNVETAKYGEGMVEEVVSAFDIIEKFTLGTVVALVLVTIFLVTNTIKLTIYSRKSEIEIMRLVGASNSAIKLPFVFEGLVLGIIGAIIPICVTIYGYIILYNALNGFLFTEMLPLVKPIPFTINVALILLGIGAIVGAFGSLNATRKYLKI